MRKIMAAAFISLDGVVEAPDQWHFPYVDEELHSVMWSTPAETMLLGRVTFQSFAGAFANLPDDNPVAQHMNAPDKVVVSRTLRAGDLGWKNSRLLPEGDVAERIRELKEGPGGQILTTGSTSLVRFMLRAGLVDQISLLVHPIVVGHGQRLFEESGPEIKLKLQEQRTLGTGVTHQVYAVL